MHLTPTELYLSVNHNGTTFQIPKQYGEKLYIRLIKDAPILIQIDFESELADGNIAMNYNMEPEKRRYVSDEDLQNIGEALVLLSTKTSEELNEPDSIAIEKFAT